LFKGKTPAASRPQVELSAKSKRKSAGRVANLKSSSWYEGATKSIAISKANSREKID
jgi:hypothetical protein